MSSPSVAALYVHPIKALRAVPVPRATVTARGFEHDRRLMLVDERGEFITQRSLPELATFDVSLERDSVRVGRADVGEVQVPLRVSSPPEVRVRIWRDEVMASPVGGELDRWLSRALGRPVRLVYMPDAVRRPVNPERVPEGAVVGFADGYPFLAVTTAALDLVSERAGRRFDARHFRPNIVLDGAGPHAEDDWAGFEVGGVRFRCVKPCDRCVVITRDPMTGEGGQEPLRTLASYRERDGKVLFGQNLVAEGTGVVAVGDAVTVLPKPSSP